MAEFRSAIAACQPQPDEAACLRFLRARKFDVAAATALFTKQLVRLLTPILMKSTTIFFCPLTVSHST